MSIDIENVLSDFRKALPLAGISTPIVFNVQNRGCPHTPQLLPRGQMAIYIFARGDQFLKIGKVGSNSNSRFQTQHYAPGSSGSNLAKSLLDDDNSDCHDVSPEQIGKWMRENLHRTDIFLSAEVGVAVLAYLEAFLHCRLKPIYEGFKSQRA